MSNAQGQAIVDIIPDLSKFTASAVAIGNLVSDAIEAGLSKAADFLTALPSIGQELQDSMNNVRVQTGLTGSALDTLNTDLSNIGANTSQKLGDVGASLGILHDRFNTLSNGDLQALDQQFANLSTITGTNLKQNVDNLGGALLVFNTKPADLSKRMDEALRSTQAAGVSLGDIVPTLNSVGASLQGVGFSYEQSLGFVASFAKVGLDASQAQLALGKVAKLASADGISAAAEWQKLTDTWKNAATPQQAFAEGADVLGTRAARMAVLVHDGTLNYQDLTKAIAGGSDTINQATTDTDTLGREWKTLQNSLKIDLAGPAVGLNAGLMDILKQARPILDSLVKDIGGAIGPPLSQIASVLGPAVIDTFKALAPVIGTVAQLFATLFTDSKPLIDAFVQSIQWFAPEFASIANAVGGVLGPALQDLAPVFSQLAGAALAIFTALGDTFVTAITALAPAFVQIAQAAAPLAVTLGVQIADALTQIAPLIPQLVTALIPLADAFLQILATNILPLFIDMLPPLITLITQFAIFTAGVLSNKDVLEPLVIVVGALWAAWQGFTILSTMTKAFQDFEMATQKGLDRVKAFFSGTMGELEADTTTTQGSTASLNASLEEVIAVLQQLVDEFQTLNIAMGNYEADTLGAAGSSEALTAALAEQNIELVGLSGEMDTLTVSEDAAAASGGALEAVMAVLEAPVTLVVAAIAALGFAIYEAYQHFQPFHDAVDAVWQALQQAWNWVVQFTEALFGGDWGKVTAMLSGVGDAIMGFFSNLPGNILSWLGDLGSLLGGWISAGFNWIVANGPGILESFAQWYIGLPGQILGWLGDLGSTLLGAVKGAFQWIWDHKEEIYDVLKTLYVDIPLKVLGWLGDLGGKLVDAVKGAFQWVVDNGPDILGSIVEWFVNIPLDLLDLWVSWNTMMFNAIKGAFQYIIDHKGEIWDFFKFMWVELPQDIIGWIGDLGGKLIDGVKAGIQYIVDHKEDVWNYFKFMWTELPGDIVGWIGDLGGKLVDALTAAWNWVVDNGPTILQKFEDWVSGIPGKILDALINVGGDAMDFAKKIFNGIAGFLNEHVFNIIADHEILGSKPFGFLKDFIPMMAEGGVVDKATTVIAGEAGKEVIIPLTKPARAAALTRESGLDKILGGGGQGGNVTYINVTVQATPDTTPAQARMVGNEAGAAIRANIPSAVTTG